MPVASVEFPAMLHCVACSPVETFGAPVNFFSQISLPLAVNNWMSTDADGSDIPVSPLLTVTGALIVYFIVTPPFDWLAGLGYVSTVTAISAVWTAAGSCPYTSEPPIYPVTFVQSMKLDVFV